MKKKGSDYVAEDLTCLTHLRRQGMSQRGRAGVAVRKGEELWGLGKGLLKLMWAGTSPLPLMEALLKFLI
jgi:hypothetical protein